MPSGNRGAKDSASRLREKFEQHAETNVKREPDTFCGEPVEVRGLMAGPRGYVMDKGFRTEGKTLIPIYEKLFPVLLVEALYDPESGERIFSRQDLDIVENLDPDEVDRVAKVAMRLAGLDKGEKATAKGNSEEGTDGPSSTPLES